MEAHDDKVLPEVLVAYMKKAEGYKKMIWDISDGVEEQCQNALKLLRVLRKPKSKM